MAMSNRVGEFERMVLLALVRLGDNAYGMTIRREIEETSGRRASIGAVYATLDRLAEKGFVDAWTGDPTPERGGRAKKFYKLKALGTAALKRSLAASAAMVDGVVLRGAEWAAE